VHVVDFARLLPYLAAHSGQHWERRKCIVGEGDTFPCDEDFLVDDISDLGRQVEEWKRMDTGGVEASLTCLSRRQSGRRKDI